MPEWQVYTQDSAAHTVVGALRLLPEIYSPQLDNTRSLLVYLPPSYHTDTEKRYPVIYMQDGQNLFDQPLAFSEEWQVDETLLELAEEGLEAIVVGIPNNDERLDEYSPYTDEAHGGGKGAAYLAFIAETIKPIVDADFRTLPDRAHTGILGSSMGGLIGLYGFLHLPEVFGFAGALSPALWFADQALYREIETWEHLPQGKLYLDAGRQELRDQHDARAKSAQYIQQIRQFRDLLQTKGYQVERNLMYIEDREGTHSEQDWARRLPDALRFLLTE